MIENFSSDMININIIPESSITLIEIKNITRVKNQNKYLKISLIIISITIVLIVINNQYKNEKKTFSFIH